MSPKKQVSFQPTAQVRRYERIVDASSTPSGNGLDINVILPLGIGWRHTSIHEEPLLEFRKVSRSAPILTESQRYNMLLHYGFDFLELEIFISMSKPKKSVKYAPAFNSEQLSPTKSTAVVKDPKHRVSLRKRIKRVIMFPSRTRDVTLRWDHCMAFRNAKIHERSQ